MSTDYDITNTRLSSSWNVTQEYEWHEINPAENAPAQSLRIADGDVIVVLAHGSNTEIGNHNPGAVDIDATRFLRLLRNNMAPNAEPSAVYLSTCSSQIAEFAARVRIAAEEAGFWGDVPIYGHSTSVAGNVPPSNSIDWYKICSTRLRRR